MSEGTSTATAALGALSGITILHDGFAAVVRGATEAAYEAEMATHDRMRFGEPALPLVTGPGSFRRDLDETLRVIGEAAR
jgi:hypothetical protein